MNRRIRCRFSGSDIQLDLSLGLFSSAGVDAGTMLLLKTVASRIPLDDLKTILDVGCGTGALGLSLAARCPEASVLMVDRDELAVEFSRRNAALNRLKNVIAASRLMTEGPHEHHYDLILSNFPAKAGRPVLEDYLKRSAALLSPGGTAALVIVHTLAGICRELLEQAGIPIVLELASGDHVVFHYTRKGIDTPVIEEPAVILEPYIRRRGSFSAGKTEYRLDTVWNIGDFDTLSWRIDLAGRLLEETDIAGTPVFWGPGQGHLPVLARLAGGSLWRDAVLAGRDRLELLITEHNLKSFDNIDGIHIRPLADTSALAGPDLRNQADFLLTDLNPVPRSLWAEPLKSAAAGLLKPGGLWMLTGRSADVAVPTKTTRGWTTVADRRYHGWRAVMFRRN